MKESSGTVVRAQVGDGNALKAQLAPGGALRTELVNHAQGSAKEKATALAAKYVGSEAATAAVAAIENATDVSTTA